MALALDGSAHVNITNSSAPSLSLTTSNANDVIIVAALVNGASIVSVSDTAGLTWSQITTGGSTNKIYLWYAVASSALSADSITLTLSGNTSFATVDAFGISGADTSTIFDANASTPASGTTSALSVSTDTADTFILGGYRFTSTASPTQGAGWTKISGANFQLVEYKIVSTTQSGLSVAIGTGNGDENGGVADAIIIAATGGGTDATASPTGVSGTGSVGSIAVNFSSNIAVTGVSATGSVGSVTVSTGANATASPTGVSATGSVGSVTVGISPDVSVTGVSATGSVGSLAFAISSSIVVTGVSATGGVGTVTVAGATSAIWSAVTPASGTWAATTPASGTWTAA